LSESARARARLEGRRVVEMGVPKSYRSIEEFEREEIRRDMKLGFSLDDLMNDTAFEQSDLLFDDTVDEYDPDAEDDDEY
jgi:hypothetical protein